MNTVYHDIFKAIHENKWLSIEYRNGREEVTKYWIGIKGINLSDKSLHVEGLHLAKFTTQELRKIYIDSILSSYVVEGSYFEVEETLKEDIKLNPLKYRSIFHNVANLKILNYLSDCNRLDNLPYKNEYSLIDKLDGDRFENGRYRLQEQQFKDIVTNFQIGVKNNALNYKIKQIALNILSINTKSGLYVLAYRPLKLDVKSRMLVQEQDITVCTEFTINGTKQSIRKFLDADDYSLLEEFEKNQEIIKDKITDSNPQIKGVDDMPYVIAIGRDIVLDLNSEFAAIVKMFEEDKITVPIKAFFGDLIKQPIRKKDYPIVLLDNKINLDQLLAIHNAIKYPLTYIQGPPGTGKTNTIINTIVTAFFNEKSLLFASYNNHPINGVCEKLQNIAYRDKVVPFPIIRLGNDIKVKEALDYIKGLHKKTKSIQIFDTTLERNKDDKVQATEKLMELLKKHEERLDLLERREAIEKLLETNKHLTFQTELYGVQLKEVNRRIEAISEISDEEALRLVSEDEQTFLKYLYYTSARYIKRLDEPKNEDLLKIVYMEEKDQVKEFNHYISQEENLRKFLRIFPVVATTCISAHKLGEPKPYFDMVIMDEASQGNTAVSLVPIIRGENLMLVGDPQQLSPVILLDPKDNQKLKRMYGVSDEYDYTKNSIYKTYLACDSISGEILLSHHYRCNRKIIEFNNKKYYNNKLIVNSNSQSDKPLVLVDIPDNKTFYKNTAPVEAEMIANYIALNRDRKIGVITPFTNQKECINDILKKRGIDDVTCGTVHAFQGDEKDEILFSMALTDKTGGKTYDWLKNNKELINVATSRAKDRLTILVSKKELERLHGNEADDIYELVQYVQTQGTSTVTPKATESRALGIKPYSTETEAAFLVSLNHALDNILNTSNRCVVQKEVSISQVFQDNELYNDLFYTGRFDFVVYSRDYYKNEIPILAIELDGKEHYENEVVMERDRKKNAICKAHGFELIRIENSYARRYNYIKEILVRYFKER